MKLGHWIAVLSALFWISAAHAKDTRPNTVLMVVEDLSPRIHAFGDPLAKTPNLDRLAAEGIRYTNVFTTAGVCAPSRAALITGMHQESIGAQHMRTSSFGQDMDEGYPYQTVPPAHVKAFPEYLRAAGYKTFNNAKTDYQFGEPFSIWDASGRDVTLTSHAGKGPFFFMFSQNDTHESRIFRQDRAIADYAKGNARRQDERLAALGERTKPEDVSIPAYLPDTPEVRIDIARHYDNIRLMDAWVGERMAELERLGLLENTIIIWTTDHGDGLPRAKRSLYDSGLKVPMIVRFPDGHGAGSVNSSLVSFVDLAPAILKLSGAPSREHFQGRDFLQSEHETPRRYIYAARDRLDEWPDRSRAVRDERFKYIRNYDPDRPFFAKLGYRENIATMQEMRRLLAEGNLAPHIAAYFQTPRPAEELYDTHADPDEIHNLAGDPAHGKTLERLRAALDMHLTEIDDWSEMPELEMVETRMWPGGKQPVTAVPRLEVSYSEDGRSAYLVEARSATDGASVEYRHESFAWPQTRKSPWKLYTPSEGAVGIFCGIEFTARAIRYGYRPSEVVTALVDRDACRNE